jgi:hypothetical protein
MKTKLETRNEKRYTKLKLQRALDELFDSGYTTKNLRVRALRRAIRRLDVEL